MASTLSKTALRGIESGRAVSAAARAHSEPVGAALETLYRPVLRDGETMPDWVFVQELNARLLDGSVGQVILTDEEHRDELVEEVAFREDRDSGTRTVQRRIRDERKSFAGAHGDESLKHVGLDKPPERKSLAVYRQGSHIVRMLRVPDLKLQPARSGAVAVNPAGVADEMEPEVEALGESLANLDRQRKATDESLVAKDEAVDQLRRTYVDVARSQESYYRLAGKDELADRMRPSIRRFTRGSSQPSPDSGEPTEAPPAPPPASESP